MANSLQGVLAQIPGLGGYLAAQQNDQQQQMGQLQQIGGLQGILAKVQAQQQEAQFRGALSQATTPEQRLAVAERYAGPKDIMAHADRQATAANTRELALARLKQAATQGNQVFQLRAQAAKDARERAAVEAEWKVFRGKVEQERLKYDTGSSVPSFQLPPMSAPAGPASGVNFNLGGVQGTVPDEAAAMALARSMGFGGGGQPQAPAQPSAPVATPEAMPAPVAPAVPNNMDARDLMLRGQPPQPQVLTPPGPMAPVTPTPLATNTPQMPQFSGSPRERTAAENRWKLQQSSPSALRADPARGDFSKVGDEYLNTLPAEMRSLVKGVAKYEINPMTFAARLGNREKMLEMVRQYNPEYDDTQYANKRRAIAQFGSGPQGNTVRSLNVAIEHIDTLKRAGEALKNGTFTPGNLAYNEVAKIFGKTPPNTFEGIRDIVANEVVKGTIGNAGALTDRAEAAGKVKAASSPEQLNELMNGWVELMGGQVKGLEQQYAGASGLKDFRERYLTQRARDAIGFAESKANPSSPAWDDAKERRYQELLRKRGGT